MSALINCSRLGLASQLAPVPVPEEALEAPQDVHLARRRHVVLAERLRRAPARVPQLQLRLLLWLRRLRVCVVDHGEEV